MTEHPTPDPVRLAFADKYDDAHAEYYYRKHRNGLWTHKPGPDPITQVDNAGQPIADPRTATNQQIMLAAKDTIPNVPLMFWLFRIMAGLGFLFIGFFALAFYCASACKFSKRGFLKIAVAIMPLPWFAIEFGWMLAEIGRQPWAVEGVLPTFLAASSLTVSQIWTTIIGFTLLYGTLAVIEVRLMIATIRKGPVEHHEPETSLSQAGYAPLPAE